MMKRHVVFGSALLALALLVVLLGVLPCWGQGRAALARETAEYIAKKFGLRWSARELQTFAGRLERLAAQHGDDAYTAARKVGPQVFHYVEQVGEEHATQVIRLLARYGDEAAWVVQRPAAVMLTRQHGDEAARALIRHGDVAMPVIQAQGARAARAFAALQQPQNGRRLRMMFDNGSLKQIGRNEELLEVIFRYGDRAMEFIWKHRTTLTFATALAAFLKDPEPFLDGIKDITQIR